MLKKAFLLVVGISLLALFASVSHLTKSRHLVESFKQVKVFVMASWWQPYQQFTERVKRANRYELMAYELLQKNQILEIKISQLQSQLSELEAQKSFFALKVQRKPKRFPSSVINPVDEKNDLVQFNTYRWKDRKLLSIARMEWQREHYIKSAQYFYTLTQTYPQSSLVNDKVLFQTAMASLEAEIYHPWAEQVLARLVNDFPRSRYYRGAKLWMGLLQFKRGNRAKWDQTVEEFRLKYRNSPEWKILSRHYEIPKKDYI